MRVVGDDEAMLQRLQPWAEIVQAWQWTEGHQFSAAKQLVGIVARPAMACLPSPGARTAPGHSRTWQLLPRQALQPSWALDPALCDLGADLISREMNPQVAQRLVGAVLDRRFAIQNRSYKRTVGSALFGKPEEPLLPEHRPSIVGSSFM